MILYLKHMLKLVVCICMYNVYMYILCLLEEWRVWLMFSWQGSACSMCELLYVLLIDVFMHKYACRMAHGSWFGWLCNFTHVILNVHAIFTQSIYLMQFDFFWQAIVNQQNIHLCARDALPTVVEFAQPWKHLNIFIQIPHNKQCSFLPCRFLIWRHTQIISNTYDGIFHTQKARLEIPTKGPFVF